jgi:replicative DNA helicase
MTEDWLIGPVAVFSLEMSREQLVGRLVSGSSKIDGERLRKGDIKESEMTRYHTAIGQIHALPLYLDDQSGLTPSQLRARCRRLAAEHGGLRLVVVDYLQLMVSDRRGDNQNAEMAYISKSLKGLAKELGCCVMAASQLNRACEIRADKRPQLSDLRDSGGIEQDADVAVFLYRDDYYNTASLEPNVIELDVKKNRAGRTGKVKMFWMKELTRVEELQQVPF